MLINFLGLDAYNCERVRRVLSYMLQSLQVELGTGTSEIGEVKCCTKVALHN